nr:EOG090X04F1 [Simocephalus serrulatus]
MTEENLDLQRKIVKALNEEIGSDLKQLYKLKELHDETKVIQNDLKEKLSLVSTEAPTKIQSTLKNVQILSERLVGIEEQYSQLKGEAESHLAAVSAFLGNIDIQLQEIDRLELEHSYLKCLKTIEDLSDKLQHSLQSNLDAEAVELYNKLVQYNFDLETSNCNNLKKFVSDTTVFWFELLKEKLRKEMQDTLKMIQWPLISTNQEVLKTVPPPDVMSKFQIQFQCLGKLKIPPTKQPEDASEHVILSRFPPPSLALQELMNPLIKRFLYHFNGNRPTNRRDKPEWYMRQILQWIEDHAKFIATNVQPLYEPNDAFLEFSRGLVQLAVEKLVKEAPVMLEDDVILAHTIGEVLSFESELRTSCNYPSSQPSALLVLTQPQFFSRWIALERAFAVQKMDDLLSSDKAWTSSSLGDGADGEDDVRITECGEGFLQMLLAITDRYKILPQPGHKLQFLDLQLELLDEFRIRLLQLARQDKYQEFFANRSSPNISPILNTLTAVINVLDDWTDLPFFVQLHSYKVQAENVERLAAEAISNDEASLPWLRTQAHIKDEDGSVFDSIIELLKRMQEDLLGRVVEAVVLEVKAKSQPYRLDKWASLPNPDEFIQPSLSPTGSSMLQAVAVGLLWLKDSLASTLFVEAWQRLAAQVNEFLFEELILQRQFNDGGAAQLCFDIQQNLIPLFGQFTTKPESYFKDLKDACILLRLPRPITLLLLDTLAVAVQESDSPTTRSSRAAFSGKQALKDQGVKKLSVENALSVLRRRIL